MSSSPVSKVEFLDKTTCSVSVVICAYSMSRLEILLAAVDAATVQANGPGDEVVVVIDHNESMLAHVRAHVPTGGVRVVPNTAEQGLSGARNCGISAGNGHLVAFLDDDAVLRTGGIDAIRATMSADPRLRQSEGQCTHGTRGLRLGGFRRNTAGSSAATTAAPTRRRTDSQSDRRMYGGSAHRARVHRRVLERTRAGRHVAGRL